jgi:hypothetical protein
MRALKAAAPYWIKATMLLHELTALSYAVATVTLFVV